MRLVNLGHGDLIVLAAFLILLLVSTLGAYAMFAAVSLLRLDRLISIAIGGLAALPLSVPTAFFVFRLQGAYFAIGTWVIAEVVRLSLAQWKALGGAVQARRFPLERRATCWASVLWPTCSMCAGLGGALYAAASPQVPRRRESRCCSARLPRS